MEPIPTVPFDNAKHVIACRERKEGRQVFVDLASLVAAENVIEGNPAPAGDYATRAELAMMRDAIAKAVSENVPPPQVPSETLAALASGAQALASIRADIEAIKRVVDTHSDMFAAIKARAGEL